MNSAWPGAFRHSCAEDINARLTQEAEGNTANRAGLVRLESQVQELSRQLRDTSEQLQATSKELGKEQARNRSVQKHGQVRLPNCRQDLGVLLMQTSS